MTHLYAIRAYIKKACDCAKAGAPATDVLIQLAYALEELRSVEERLDDLQDKLKSAQSTERVGWWQRMRRKV